MFLGISDCYEKKKRTFVPIQNTREKLQGTEDRREDFFIREKKRNEEKKGNETKRDYGNVVVERKNFPHIILKYVLCSGRVEIVAPYP